MSGRGSLRNSLSPGPSGILDTGSGASDAEGNVNPSDQDRNDLGNGVPYGTYRPMRANGPPEDSDRWLRSVVENSSEIVTIVDPDGTLRYANPAWERALGYDPDRAIGTMNVLDHVHPEDLAHVLEETQEALAEGGVTTNEAEYRFRHADGSWRWMESVGTYLLDDPAVGGVVVTSRDVTERKEAEEALRRNEQYFRSVVRNASDVITVLEADGTIRYVSPALEKVTGYRPEEHAGANAFDSVHPEDKQRALGLFAKILKTPGGHLLIEFRVPHKDGSWRYLEHVVNNLLDDPSVNGIVVTSRDVTERKESEERLRRAEERYRTLVERVPAVVYVQEIGSPDSAMYMSPRIEALTGYTPEECKDPAMRWHLVHPEDRELMQSEDEQTGEPGEVFTSEYRVLHRDGRTVWVRNESVLIEDEASGSRYWQGFMVDITERRRVEVALKESEQRFRRSFDDAAIGMALVGTDGRFLRTNRSLREILGYPEVELLGKTFQDITHPDDLDADLYHFDRILAGEMRAYQTEKRYMHKEGHVVWALLSVSMVHDEEGEPLYFVSQIQNISERKRAEEALKESEQRFRSTFEDAPIGVALVGLPSSSPDSATRYLRVNRTLCEMLGYAEEELLSMTSSDVTHPEDLEESRARAERLVEAGGSKYTIEKRYVRSDGRVVWAMLNVSLVRDSEGSPSHFVSQYQDVTQRKETEEALRRSEERYRNVVEEQTELVCRFLPDLTLTFANDAYCRYFEKSSEELVGGRFLDDVREADHAYYEEQLTRLNPESPTATVEERALTPGGLRWLHWADTAIFDVDGRIVEYQSVGRDVTERREAEERLEYQAFYDPLTRLPNRALFMDRLDHALSRANRQESKVAVLFVDLDNFKVINDSLGHEAGDQLLVAVGERLKGCLRPEDTAARLGGDEFTILIEDVNNVNELTLIAERITEILQPPFALEVQELFVTISIGIAFSSSAEERSENLLRAADLAMYRAKQRGKARYEVFDRSMHTNALERLVLETELRRAVELGEFKVYYQPIVAVENGRIAGLEALVRWEHPKRGLLLPREFLSIAEETGLIVRIDHWVLREACKQARAWQERYPNAPLLTVAVNVSPKQIFHPELVAKILGEIGIDPSTLHVEITEDAMMKSNAARSADYALRALKDLGVKLAMDDFGMGYSSLAHLKRFPVDFLKIDRSFINALGQDINGTSKDLEIVSAMIHLTHALGLKVVVEGVESLEQLEQLQGMGCDFVQGNYFSEPLPGEGISVLMDIL